MLRRRKLLFGLLEGLERLSRNGRPGRGLLPLPPGLGVGSRLVPSRLDTPRVLHLVGCSPRLCPWRLRSPPSASRQSLWLRELVPRLGRVHRRLCLGSLGRSCLSHSLRSWSGLPLSLDLTRLSRTLLSHWCVDRRHLCATRRELSRAKGLWGRKRRVLLLLPRTRRLGWSSPGRLPSVLRHTWRPRNGHHVHGSPLLLPGPRLSRWHGLVLLDPLQTVASPSDLPRRRRRLSGGVLLPSRPLRVPWTLPRWRVLLPRWPPSYTCGDTENRARIDTSLFKTSKGELHLFRRPMYTGLKEWNSKSSVLLSVLTFVPVLLFLCPLFTHPSTLGRRSNPEDKDSPLWNPELVYRSFFRRTKRRSTRTQV